MTRSDDTVTVMLVDDHLLFRKGLRALIEKRPDIRVVAEAGDGEEAVRLYDATLPDIALVDIGLPGEDGVQVIQRIVSAHPEAKLVVLSATDFDDQVIRSIRAGAMGYLVKNLEPDELFATIDTVSRGNACLSRKRLAQIIAPGETETDRPDMLSPRETQILSLVAEGLTNRQIAEQLVITSNTVKAHIANIMSKLGLHNRVELAAWRIESVGEAARQ